MKEIFIDGLSDIYVTRGLTFLDFYHLVPGENGHHEQEVSLRITLPMTREGFLALFNSGNTLLKHLVKTGTITLKPAGSQSAAPVSTKKAEAKPAANPAPAPAKKAEAKPAAKPAPAPAKKAEAKPAAKPAPAPAKKAEAKPAAKPAPAKKAAPAPAKKPAAKAKKSK